jgi:AraC-like DNA-binding protein
MPQNASAEPCCPTAAELPLDHHVICRTEDVDVLLTATNQRLWRQELELVDPASRLDARLHSRRLRDIVVSFLCYGTDVRTHWTTLDTCYVVQLPVAGACTVYLPDRRIATGPGRGVVLPLGEEVTGRWTPDCAALVVRLERPALEERLRDTLDQSLTRPIVFQPWLDVTEGRPRAWHAALEFCVREMNRLGSLVDSATTAGYIHDFLLSGLLIAQPHNYTDLLNGVVGHIPSRTVGIAVELMHSHPDRRHTVSSLAKEAGVSVRALEDGFRRQLDTTPHAYLRELRLRRARTELLAADSSATTVATIAARAGFLHLGWFAATYKRRFGETPSQTLHRK